MNANQLFVKTLDFKLASSSEHYLKSTCSRFEEGIEVTTYCWENKKLIIDVIGEECCFTAPGKNHIVFEFSLDEIEGVVDDLIREIDEVVIGF